LQNVIKSCQKWQGRQKLAKVAKLCKKYLKCAKSCQQVSKVVKNSQMLQQVLKNCQEFPTVGTLKQHYYP